MKFIDRDLAEGYSRSIISVGRRLGAAALVASLPLLHPVSSFAQETTTILDPATAQTQADKNFAQWDTQMHDLYPWLDRLPIEGRGYHVHFDIDTKQFMAYVIPDCSSGIANNQQVTGSTAELSSKLDDLIPEHTNYPTNLQVFNC